MPRPWLLAGSMLVGIATGTIAAIAARLVVDAQIRPDVVVALVVGVPSTLGLLLILLSSTRWLTALGAFLLAVGPGWFGVLVAAQAVNGV